ncbi:5661_t:CDS:2, partial [Racocetra persica]
EGEKVVAKRKLLADEGVFFDKQVIKMAVPLVDVEKHFEQILNNEEILLNLQVDTPLRKKIFSEELDEIILGQVEFRIMSRLATLEKNLNRDINQRQNYAELVSFYNRLDQEQKVEFRHKLEKIIKQPVLPQRIEKYLHSLNQKGYERMLIYVKLLLKNGESSVKDLSPFYEDIISDLKELMKRVIEYDDVIIHLRPLIAGCKRVELGASLQRGQLRKNLKQTQEELLEKIRLLKKLDEEIETLKQELEGERAAAQERPARHLSFLGHQYPQQFAELEARGNLNAIRQDLTEKHNVEKANHQTTQNDLTNEQKQNQILQNKIQQ